MKLPEWDRKLQRWDRFQAFHIAVTQSGPVEDASWRNSPMVMFDTGEVIFTHCYPRPDVRGTYRALGLEVLTSKDLKGELYAPDGKKIAIAWLYDSGQQYLLLDEDTKRIVRLSDINRHRGYSSGNYHHEGSPIVPGVPERFQYGCSAYVPGPGLPPVGMQKIVAWLPFKASTLDAEQRAHVQMIVDTARAALKLTDNPAIRGYAPAASISSGCPIDIILKCQTWQDLPAAHYHSIFHYGVQRQKMEYDYLLTEKP